MKVPSFISLMMTTLIIIRGPWTVIGAKEVFVRSEPHFLPIPTGDVDANKSSQKLLDVFPTPTMQLVLQGPNSWSVSGYNIAMRFHGLRVERDDSDDSIHLSSFISLSVRAETDDVAPSFNLTRQCCITVVSPRGWDHSLHGHLLLENLRVLPFHSIFDPGGWHVSFGGASDGVLFLKKQSVNGHEMYAMDVSLSLGAVTVTPPGDARPVLAFRGSTFRALEAADGGIVAYDDGRLDHPYLRVAGVEPSPFSPQNDVFGPGGWILNWRVTGRSWSDGAGSADEDTLLLDLSVMATLGTKRHQFVALEQRVKLMRMGDRVQVDQDIAFQMQRVHFDWDFPQGIGPFARLRIRSKEAGVGATTLIRANTLDDGSFFVDSFFDVFVELTVDDMEPECSSVSFSRAVEPLGCRDPAEQRFPPLHCGWVTPEVALEDGRRLRLELGALDSKGGAAARLTLLPWVSAFAPADPFSGFRLEGRAQARLSFSDDGSAWEELQVMFSGGAAVRLVSRGLGAGPVGSITNLKCRVDSFFDVTFEMMLPEPYSVEEPFQVRMQLISTGDPIQGKCCCHVARSLPCEWTTVQYCEVIGGSCAVRASRCPTDFDFDGQTHVSDLARVLVSWDNCPDRTPIGSPCLTNIECLQGVCRCMPGTSSCICARS